MTCRFWKKNLLVHLNVIITEQTQQTIVELEPTCNERRRFHVAWMAANHILPRGAGYFRIIQTTSDQINQFDT